MSKSVEFKFSPNDKVLTPFGEMGIITTASIDETGVKSYYVKTKDSTGWWNEDKISEWKADCVQEGN